MRSLSNIYSRIVREARENLYGSLVGGAAILGGTIMAATSLTMFPTWGVAESNRPPLVQRVHEIDRQLECGGIDVVLRHCELPIDRSVLQVEKEGIIGSEQYARQNVDYTNEVDRYRKPIIIGAITGGVMLILATLGDGYFSNERRRKRFNYSSILPDLTGIT